jgi:rRNA maturation RNase YbeY
MADQSESFIISNTTKGKLPRLPFVMMKERVLGADYELSLVFLSPAKARALNLMYRGKTYTPNILSFPLDKKNGEIFICPNIAKKEASLYNLSFQKFVGYLFIHGLFHLKGMKHSSTMETSEKKVRELFNIK